MQRPEIAQSVLECGGPLVPFPVPALTCAELADRCSHWTGFPPEEANAFADDVESARRNLPPLKSAWD
jgi:hypothetical protein